MKANVSEAEHPLLCESTRRQRGELAIAMLVHYKDDPIKLSKVNMYLILMFVFIFQCYLQNVTRPMQYSFTNLYSITPHYQIMDKLLDKEVHQLYKAPSLVNYLGVKTPSSSVSISTSSNPGTSPNPLPPGAGAEAASTPRTGSMASGGASAQPTVNSPSEVNTVPNRASAGARPKITYPLRYNRYVSIQVLVYHYLLWFGRKVLVVDIGIFFFA